MTGRCVQGIKYGSRDRGALEKFGPSRPRRRPSQPRRRRRRGAGGLPGCLLMLGGTWLCRTSNWRQGAGRTQEMTNMHVCDERTLASTILDRIVGLMRRCPRAGLGRAAASLLRSNIAGACRLRHSVVFEMELQLQAAVGWHSPSRDKDAAASPPTLAGQREAWPAKVHLSGCLTVDVVLGEM